MEEFDLPKERGFSLDREKEFDISTEGIEKLLPFLEEHGVKCTFFTTASFARAEKGTVRKIAAKGHEIAFHGSSHSVNYSQMNTEEAMGDLAWGKKELEKIYRKRVIGFRAPRFQRPPERALEKTGIKYDSSIHPTWVSNRYNYFFHKRKIHTIKGLIEVPVSTSPFFRMPLSWIWFRSLPFSAMKASTAKCIEEFGFLNLYFHSWEFSDFAEKDFSRRLGYFVKKNTGKALFSLLGEFFEFIEKRGKFCKMESVIFPKNKSFN